MAANPQERFGLAIHLSQARLQDTQPAEGARMQPERPLREGGSVGEQASNEEPRRPRGAPEVLAALLAGLLAAGAIAVDLATWMELNVSIAFTVPLVAASLSRSRKLLWTLTAILTASTFAIYALQIPPGAFHIGEVFFVDRVLSSATVIAVAILLAMRMRYLDRL
ncbi:MAG TPA: hypothetical protein VFJ86_07870, partial [Usitatibacter sp.]|nr:hypothetical protein [Usitatibacter sp.]